ncbi:Uncharacterised protein [Acinetobacter baumannii]|nr:Uncharacterised protein [Acinetobacter baumannii]
MTRSAFFKHSTATRLSVKGVMPNEPALPFLAGGSFNSKAFAPIWEAAVKNALA